jgi:hypothetical protein
MKKVVFSGQTFFIYLSQDIAQEVSSRRFRCSDDLSGTENVFQSERLDLLPVFRFLCEVHLEQQK